MLAAIEADEKEEAEGTEQLTAREGEN
jgi:hypothetical protein